MTKAVFLFPFVILFVCEHLQCAKETSLQHTDRSISHKKLLHGEKQKPVLSHRTHYVPNWNYNRRCEIVCSCSSPSNFGENFVKPNTAPTTSSSKTTTTTEGASDETESETNSESSETSNSTTQNKNITTKYNKPMKHGLTRLFRIAASKELINTLGHGGRKHSYHQLTDRQKHILLKQLNLGNRQRKGAYKFQQLNLYRCQLICRGEEQIPEPTQQLTLNEEGGDVEDGYEEGEDVPIEITVPPIAPQNNVIAGIRPISSKVDFMGMDDFGPTGELAYDPSTIFEEKHNIKKNEKEKQRKNAVVAEKRNS